MTNPPQKKASLNQSIAALESPVHRSERPPSSKDSGPLVDSDKLVKLVEALIALMKDQLAAMDKASKSNEEQARDNEATRRAVKGIQSSTRVTRFIMMASMVGMLVSMGLIVKWSKSTLQIARDTKTSLSATLNATSLEQEARAANAKAESTFEPEAIKEAEAKTLQAEAAIAMAQQVVAPTPKVREQATAKLANVKKRAKAMKVKLGEPHGQLPKLAE